MPNMTNLLGPLLVAMAFLALPTTPLVAAQVPLPPLNCVVALTPGGGGHASCSFSCEKGEALEVYTMFGLARNGMVTATLSCGGVAFTQTLARGDFNEWNPRFPGVASADSSAGVCQLDTTDLQMGSGLMACGPMASVGNVELIVGGVPSLLPHQECPGGCGGGGGPCRVDLGAPSPTANRSNAGASHSVIGRLVDSIPLTC